MDIDNLHFQLLWIELIFCLGLVLVEAEHLMAELYRLLQVMLYAMGWVVLRSSWLSDY
jgi:hypothetical protein